MKKITLFLLLITSCCLAQKEDYIMFSGYDSEQHSTIPRYGNTTINFNYTPVNINYQFQSGVDYLYAHASICTPEGRFLFASDGVQVIDSTFQIMMDGDSINSGSPEAYYNFGYFYVHGVLIVPRPNTSQYYLFQDYLGQIPWPDNRRYTNLWVSTIDMSLNNGRGTVIQKNRALDTTWLNSCFLSATKHANGRDWWLMTRNKRRHQYFTYLISPLGISPRYTQTIGQAQTYDYRGTNSQSNFAPDGSKLASGDFIEGVAVLDFDRCTGQVSNKRIIPVDSLAGRIGVAFSPNSRYLYIVRGSYILQADTEASDIVASIDTVAHYDGFYYNVGTTQVYTPFFVPYNTPDGRIFIPAGGGSNRYLHTIENPNEAGVACNVQQHSIFLPTNNNGTTPNFPTYRLGAQVGSGCDTVYTAASPSPSRGGEPLRLFPNPATNNTRLVWDEPLRTAASLYITNSIGQVVKSIAVEKGFTYQDIEVKDLPNGIYFIRLSTTENQMFTAKLIKIQ